MSRPLFGIALVVCALVGLSPAQEKGTPPAKSKGKAEVVPGYEQRTMEGFYLLVNRKVLTEIEASKGKYEVEPLDVLESELKALNTILVPKMLKAMQTVRIFVEWDDLPPGQKLSEEEKER